MITVYWYDFRTKAHVPVSIPREEAERRHLTHRMVISEEYAQQILAQWT